MSIKLPLYRTKRIAALYESGQISRQVKLACESANPPLITAGDVLDYLIEHGTFSEIPGCRRPGRISHTLAQIAEYVINPPEDYEGYTEDILFGFADHDKRVAYETHLAVYGHYPMFRILVDYLNSGEAERDDIIFGMLHGLRGEPPMTINRISERIGLSKERIRQIHTTYRLPERIGAEAHWSYYGDYSTYFIGSKSKCFLNVVNTEMESLDFATYADVLSRVLTFESAEGRYLVRNGWEHEVESWIKTLERITAHPRLKESRISIDGLAMGGTLDIRLKQTVITDIAPSLGITATPPDSLVFPSNSR